MSTRRPWRGAFLAAVLAVAGLGLAPTAAHAELNELQKLCSAPATHPCSIAMDNKAISAHPEEGSTVYAAVTGPPNMTVKLRAYYIQDRVIQRDGTPQKVRYVGDASDVITVKLDANGKARVSAKTGDLPHAFDSDSFITIQPDGGHLVMVGDKPNYFSPSVTGTIISKRPFDLGITTKIDKDGNFARSVRGALTNQRFSIQLYVNKTWVSADAGAPVAGKGAGITVLPGGLPTNLRPGDYPMRFINVTSNITHMTFKNNKITWAITPDSPRFNVYTIPGTWDYNGRKWRTTCEPYSATERCRTELIATQILMENGRFVRKTDWAFNNLTYLPSPRSIWRGNPLGGNGQVKYEGSWQSDGRQWRVECDNATTGRGGCRSYIYAKVGEQAPGGGYRAVDKWVFNNIVLFS